MNIRVLEAAAAFTVSVKGWRSLPKKHHCERLVTNIQLTFFSDDNI
jgi:hypothetical protein